MQSYSLFLDVTIPKSRYYRQLKRMPVSLRQLNITYYM